MESGSRGSSSSHASTVPASHAAQGTAWELPLGAHSLDVKWELPFGTSVLLQMLVGLKLAPRGGESRPVL